MNIEFIVTLSCFVGIQVKVVLRADVSSATYDKVAIISGFRPCKY
jgi:hypothetical protein